MAKDPKATYVARLVRDLVDDFDWHIAHEASKGNLIHYEVENNRLYRYLTEEDYQEQLRKHAQGWRMPEVNCAAHLDSNWKPNG